MSEFVDRELGWDDEISHDEQERIVLPDGDYLFEVVKYERSRFKGSDKIPPSNMAIVTLRINDEVDVQERLILHTKMEWKLCSFFASIGLRKKNEPLRMNWSEIPGRHGICKLGHRTYKNNSNVDVAINQVEQFYYEDEAPTLYSMPQPQTQPPAPSYPQQQTSQWYPQQTPYQPPAQGQPINNGKWTRGSF